MPVGGSERGLWAPFLVDGVAQSFGSIPILGPVSTTAETAIVATFGLDATVFVVTPTVMPPDRVRLANNGFAAVTKGAYQLRAVNLAVFVLITEVDHG